MERFWAKTRVHEPTDCWLWTAACNKFGYPLFSLSGKQRRATHVALELSGRPRPSGEDNNALHSDECVSRSCVNPAHLRWGTLSENSQDAIRVGTLRPPRLTGERHGNAKLTNEAVRAIRESAESCPALARAYGVDQKTVWRVKTGKQWAHVG